MSLAFRSDAVGSQGSCDNAGIRCRGYARLCGRDHRLNYERHASAVGWHGGTDEAPQGAEANAGPLATASGPAISSAQIERSLATDH